jgi:DNA-directed RNA polymerase specialized sigma24 family protein
MASIDEELFKAWLSGDQEARQQAWALLWSKLYTMSVRFCASRHIDVKTAEELASESFANAMQEIDSSMKKQRIEWLGENSFVAYVRKLLILRCRDALRRLWTSAERLKSLESPVTEDEPDEVPLLNVLATALSSPEDVLLAKEEARERISRQFLWVSVARAAHNGRKALEYIEARKKYLRHCLARALPTGTDSDDWSEDRLLEEADLNKVVINKTDMNEFIMRFGFTRAQVDNFSSRIGDLSFVTEND